MRARGPHPRTPGGTRAPPLVVPSRPGRPRAPIPAPSFAKCMGGKRLAWVGPCTKWAAAPCRRAAPRGWEVRAWHPWPRVRWPQGPCTPSRATLDSHPILPQVGPPAPAGLQGADHWEVGHWGGGLGNALERFFSAPTLFRNRGCPAQVMSMLMSMPGVAPGQWDPPEGPREGFWGHPDRWT